MATATEQLTELKQELADLAKQAERLAASHRRFVLRDLIATGCVIVQDGDDGVNATFPLEAFDEVAEIMKPRKRRRMTDEQRQAATERLRRYREGPAAQRNSPQETPERPISTLVDI